MPVTRFEIVLRRPLAGGRAFGDVGPYEELKGRIHLAVDPANVANAAITDLSLAPRDAGAWRVRRTCRSCSPSIPRAPAGACSSMWSTAATW